MVSVEGYCDDSKSGAIQGIQFKTNIKTSEQIGYDNGKKFILAANGKKIIGFHGYAEKNLISLGAYFTTSPFTKVACEGGTTVHELWDDGAFQGVRKVYVHYEKNYVWCLRVVYDYEGKATMLEHGRMSGQEEEVLISTTINTRPSHILYVCILNSNGLVAYMKLHLYCSLRSTIQLNLSHLWRGL